MKKRILSILLLCCMVLTLLPTAAFAEGSTEELPVCTCETACMAESINDDCSVCGAEGASVENCAKYAAPVNGEGSGTGTSRQALTNVAITFPTPEAGKPVGDGSAVSANADSGLTLYLFGPALWKQGEEPDKLDENAAYAEGNTYLLNFTFYTQKPITDETVLTYNGKPITRYADYQALTEALGAYDGTQDAYLGCVLFSAEGTGDPAMEDLKDLYLLSLYAFVRVPEAQIPEDTVDEQFTLAPGGTYYFDLSAMSIPGTVNDALPDKTMHYVPFTYAGTVDAYKLTSAMAATDEYAEKNKYAHSLFIADYNVTHTISWNDLNTAGLIFGKGYAAGGVDYTLRAPSAGSSSTGPSFSIHGAPQSNEWDRILDKDERYIQNIVGLYSWGQDTPSASASQRVGRGYYPLRGWSSAPASYQTADAGFRPVLEVLGLDKLGYDGLKAVTLDLGGGTLGGSSEDIQIIVKSGKSFAAPASDGLTRPDGNTGYFVWLGSDGNLYMPGKSVPANVDKLTAQFDLTEQFDLAPDGTYYFDLSGVSIPGTVNDALPDKTRHYVPFTYAGTVDAYKLASAMAITEEDAEKYKYAHSLFVADYAVTHTTSWDELNTASLIFGKDYAAGGVDYTLRAPSVGSGSIGSAESQRGTPPSNEWDRILDKDDRHIKNLSNMFSWGQDNEKYPPMYRAVRGYFSARYWGSGTATGSSPLFGFRPILEVLNPGSLGPDGLKAVTLGLGGGKLGNSSEDIQIIVKKGSEFTAPASDGLTRPDGNPGSYFKWLGSDGNLYAPGDNVPAEVTKLTARFAHSGHSVTITTDTLSDGKVGVAYSQTLTADVTNPITWHVTAGELPKGLSLNRATGEISGTPKAAGAATFTVMAANSLGSDTKVLTITIAKAQQYGKVSMDFYIYGETPSTPSLTDRTGDPNAQVTYYYNTTNSNSGGTKWENIQPDTLNAGTRYYMYAELGETENYDSFTTACKKFWVMKAIPTCTKPTGLTAKYGQTLADVTLPGGWSWMDSSESVGGASTAAKKFMAKFTPTDTDNYNTVENIELEVTVNKADGRNLKTVELERKYTDTSEHTYTPDWAGLPSGQTWRYNSEYSVSTGSNVTLTKHDFAADSSLLTYAISGGKAGDKITLTLKASCDNYKDFTITLNVTLTEKDDQKALTITGNTSVIYGEKLTLTTTGGSGSGAVTYAVTNGTGEATIDATGKLTPVKVGKVKVSATKAGDASYNSITSAEVEITITRATPTGAPKYTAITTSGKTLKDAALTIEGSTLSPNDGKLEWVDDEGNILPDDTKVKANKTYKWRFTPDDDNYTTLTGEVELYHKSSSGGGGSSSGYSYYTIKAIAGTGGSISPSGNVSVREGRDQTFTITPDKGYAVSRVKIDGKSIGAVKSYTFENVSRAHTIEVIFVKGTASANTGDSSNLGLWSITLITSLAGCLALAAWQRRRRREEDSPQITEK